MTSTSWPSLAPRFVHAQDRLEAEQQRCQKLEAELDGLRAAQQTAAAEGTRQLAVARQALTDLEEEASQKLHQADAAVMEAEGQLEEVTNELQDARDAVKVQQVPCLCGR